MTSIDLLVSCPIYVATPPAPPYPYSSHQLLLLLVSLANYIPRLCCSHVAAPGSLFCVTSPAHPCLPCLRSTSDIFTVTFSLPLVTCSPSTSPALSLSFSLSDTAALPQLHPARPQMFQSRLSPPPHSSCRASTDVAVIKSIQKVLNGTEADWMLSHAIRRCITVNMIRRYRRKVGRFDSPCPRLSLPPSHSLTFCPLCQSPIASMLHEGDYTS